MHRRMEWTCKSHLWLHISSSSVRVTLNDQHLCLLQSDQNSSSEVSLESKKYQKPGKKKRRNNQNQKKNHSTTYNDSRSFLNNL